MKKSEIVVGGLYLAKVSNSITTVRVDAIREIDGYLRDPRKQTPCTTVYDVTNTRTGRKITFRSAAKFRGVAKTAEQKEKERRAAILVKPLAELGITPKVPNVGINDSGKMASDLLHMIDLK